jgi:hypothetical protein
MVLDEKSCKNFTWHALDNVTWDFVLFFSGPSFGSGPTENIVGPMVSKKSQSFIHDFYFKRAFLHPLKTHS